MKVLHIIDSGGLYGAEMVLLNLVAEQMKLGLEPTIASIGKKHIPEKPLETEAIKRGFRVVKFRMFPGPNPYGMLKVLRYARHNGFDILHSHGYKGDVAFGLMPRGFRKLPLVSTLHGWTSVKGISKNAIYEWLQRKSLGHMDAVVLVHEAMLSHPRLKNLNGVNFHVVNNGIPISNDAPSEAPSFTPSDDAELDQQIVSFCTKGFTIGSIGRLSKEKGYKYLIEALALLTRNRIEARLIILGEGSERKSLDNLVEDHNLRDMVLMPGYIAHAKKNIPHFNLFVLPSITEGLPITLLEAMQANVPIIATNVGGMSEVLQEGKGGLLVDPGRPKNLAEAISRLYHDPSLAKDLASASYQTALTKYTSKTMALAYLDSYEKSIRHTHLRFDYHVE